MVTMEIIIEQTDTEREEERERERKSYGERKREGEGEEKTTGEEERKKTTGGKGAEMFVGFPKPRLCSL